MSDRNCPICGGESAWEQIPKKDEFTHECSECGRFKVSGLKSTTLPAQLKANPALREGLPLLLKAANARGETPELDDVFIDEAHTRGAT